MKHKNSLFIWLIVVVAICVAYFFVMYFCFPGNMEKRGQFGDMFGFLGALFSGLAFAGLIVTIRQQREDLKNQRDEIELQREDLKAQTEALKLQKEEIKQTNEELKLQRKELQEQNKTIMLQRFETTFYNMLDFQMRIYDQVRYENEIMKVVKTGNDAINFIFREYKTRLLTTSVDYNRCLPVGELDHCHRHLTQILIQIDKADFLSLKEKNDYVKQLSANLSYQKLVFYFCYCLSSYGRREAKVLVEKYALFRDFGNKTVFDIEHMNFFKQGAYIAVEE